MYAVADTHALIWYLLADTQLSTAARDACDEATRLGEPIGVPAISLIEIICLTEKGRIPGAALAKLQRELNSVGSVLAVVPIDQALAFQVQNIDRSIVPEMPDRIIAATALQLGVPLITKDHKIQAAGIKIIW
jgi:PIN domain nuclease of toxin-antitoxin system